MTDEDTTPDPVKSPNFWFPILCVAAAVASTLMLIAAAAYGPTPVGMFWHSGPLEPIMQDSSRPPSNGDPGFSTLGMGMLFFFFPAIIGVLVAFVVERTTKFPAWQKVSLWLIVVVPAVWRFGEFIFQR
jgi:hypothetical protein